MTVESTMTLKGGMGMTSSREEVVVFGDTIILRDGVGKDMSACMMAESDDGCPRRD